MEIENLKYVKSKFIHLTKLYLGISLLYQIKIPDMLWKDKLRWSHKQDSCIPMMISKSFIPIFEVCWNNTFKIISFHFTEITIISIFTIICFNLKLTLL